MRKLSVRPWPQQHDGNPPLGTDPAIVRPLPLFCTTADMAASTKVPNVTSENYSFYIFTLREIG